MRRPEAKPGALARAVLCGASLVVVQGTAHAHGELAPQALSLATPAADGAAVVRLTEGLARREGEHFRYVCPALWGDDDMQQAVGLRDGPTLIAASRGLFVLDAEGVVTEHPDREAQTGQTLALRAGGERLWQLRITGDSGQLTELSASAVERRFADSPYWQSMAAGEQRVQLVRLSGGGMLQQLLLSAEGEELARSSVPVPTGTRAAFARMSGGQPYVLLLLQGGMSFELGRVDGGDYVPLERAATIAGPVELASGERFVGLGGALFRFDDDELREMDEEALVTCLERVGERAHACADGGLRELTGEGLGRVWFSLDQLEPPAEVPAEHAQACEHQWQRFRLDLLKAGVPVEPDPAPADGGMGGGDASGPQEPADASDLTPGVRASGCGCRVGAGLPAPGAAGFRLAGLLLALALFRYGQRKLFRGG